MNKCQTCYYNKTLGRQRLCNNCKNDDCYKYSSEETEIYYVFKGLPSENMYDD